MIQSVNKYHIYEICASDGKFYYSIPKYHRVFFIINILIVL